MNKKDRRGQGGFTLIELMVVLAILAVLAGVIVFAVGNSKRSAHEAACRTEKAAATSAISAAVAGREASNALETPSNYLDTNAGNPTYWTYAEVGTTSVYVTDEVSGAPSGTTTCSF